MRVILVFTAVLLLSTAANVDTVVRCDGCGNVQMEARALLAYSDFEPTVHVVDSVNNRVRSYRVTYVTGGTGLDPLEIGPEPTATLIATPADVQAGFDEAMKILDHAQQGTSIPADTLPRMDNTGYINSASDIIINSGNLVRVEGHLSNNFMALTQAFAVEVLNEYLEDVAMRIRFADGSTILVTLRGVLEPNGDIAIEFVYVEDSARTGNGERIPDSEDDFNGLQIALGDGTPGAPEFLEDLAAFWNIPIVNTSGTHIGGGTGNEYVCRATDTGVLCSRQVN